MECLFCDIVKGKTPSFKVYEDGEFMAVFDIRPANPGHLILFPKRHVVFLSDMSDEEIGKFFSLASKLASLVVKAVEAKGYNLIYSAGAQAGQLTPHVILHIIPRFEGDEVKIFWEPKSMNEEDFERIREKLLKFFEGKEEKKKERKEEKKLYKVEPRIPRYW